MTAKRILVLGVGNILLGDEGTGVRVIEKLEDEYQFPENVVLYDGGTVGLRLLDPISEADFVVVIDIVRGGSAPGTIYRIPEEDLPKKIPYKSSLHELNLVETLIYSEELGNKPDAVVIGVEPGDWTSWSTELTEPVRSSMEGIVSAVLEEVKRAGGSWRKRQRPLQTWRVV
ncbi:MAG: HyaD/HybD family hydrogenase maturation endopeptidase [Desulfobacteraceae bacterium]|nr:HyaD/HybD family hydrogenase maturation endopeptidase [Desulfobacteraceae bacterium]